MLMTEAWNRPLSTISEDEIERVALAIERTMFAPHELPLPPDLHIKYRGTAVAAINAASLPRAHAQHPAVWRVRYCGQWMYFEDKANAEIYAQGDDNTEPLYTATLTPAAVDPAQDERAWRKPMQSVVWWLEGCLKCKTWHWDGDQREAAEDALKEAQAVLTAPRTPAGVEDLIKEAWEVLEGHGFPPEACSYLPAAIDSAISCMATAREDLTKQRDQALSQVERLQHQNDALNRALDVYRLAVDEQPFAPSHTSTVSPSGVMAAAANAAKVVEGWSDSKKEYADRVVGASNSPHVSPSDAGAK
jgi:hypothetical protein